MQTRMRTRWKRGSERLEPAAASATACETRVSDASVDTLGARSDRAHVDVRTAPALVEGRAIRAAEKRPVRVARVGWRRCCRGLGTGATAACARWRSGRAAVCHNDAVDAASALCNAAHVLPAPIGALIEAVAVV